MKNVLIFSKDTDFSKFTKHYENFSCLKGKDASEVHSGFDIIIVGTDIFENMSHLNAAKLIQYAAGGGKLIFTQEALVKTSEIQGIHYLTGGKLASVLPSKAYEFFAARPLYPLKKEIESFTFACSLPQFEFDILRPGPAADNHEIILEYALNETVGTALWIKNYVKGKVIGLGLPFEALALEPVKRIFEELI